MENDSFELQGGAKLPEGMYAAAASVSGSPAKTNAPRNDGINIANMSDEDLLSAINAPLTGEEVAVKMAELNNAGIDINSSTISFDEFLAYDEWRKKQHFSFWGAVGDGVATAAVDIGKGVGSALTDPKKLALAAGVSFINPALGITAAYGSSLVEGFARGTRDLAGLVVMAANHPSSPLYRMFINPDGDKQQSYKDFLDLAEWNNSTENILKGKTNAFMPDRSTYEKLLGRKLGGQVDDFIGVNNHLATAASYVLDPTVFLTFGAGSASKAAAKAVAAKAGTAALKSGHVGSQVAGAVAATSARNAFKSTWLNSVGEGMVKMSGLVTRPLEATYEAVAKVGEKVLGVKPHITPISGNVNLPRVNPSAGHAPASFTHGVLGAAGVYSIFQIPYAIPLASVYGVAKAVTYAGQALADLGKTTSKTAGKGVAQAALHSTGAFGGYMAELAKTTLKGGMYGGLIGGVAAGEEGAAGGIGTGATLGAIGHNVGAVYGTVSGKFSMMQIQSEYKNRIKEYKDKGFVLQAENMQKFYDDIASEHGEEAATKLASQILMLEKGKNTSVALLSVDNMRNTLLMNPDFYTEVDVPAGQIGAFGQGPRKQKVLNDLGKMVLANGEAGGRLWNGLFVEVDPKTGQIFQTPISQRKDRASGRNHIIINIDALRYARDENGNILFDEVKGLYRVQGTEQVTKTVKKTRIETTERKEQFEGPRPKVGPNDPTVPKDGPPYSDVVLVDKDGNPVPALEEAGTSLEEFVPREKGRIKNEYIGRLLYGQYRDMEAKQLIDEKGNIINEKGKGQLFDELRKLSNEERIEAVKEHDKAALEIKKASEEAFVLRTEVENKYKSLNSDLERRLKKGEINLNEFQKLADELFEKKEKEIKSIYSKRNKLKRNQTKNMLIKKHVDEFLSADASKRKKWYDDLKKSVEEYPEGDGYNLSKEEFKDLEDALIKEGIMSKDGRFTSEPAVKETPKEKGKSVDKKFGLTVDNETGLAEVPYTIKTQEPSGYGEKPKPVVMKSGTASLLDQGGRKIVIKSVNGILVPFYLSTGAGGKKNVPAGKWYPFFGVDLNAPKGPWINKTSEAEIARYYDSPELKKAAQELDALFGDIRDTDKGQKVSDKGKHMEVINRNGEWGVSRETSEGKAKLRQNIDNLKAEIKAAGKTETKVPAPTPKAAPQLSPVKDIPARKQRTRKPVEVFGPAKPLEQTIIDTKVVEYDETVTETVPFDRVQEGTKKVPRIGGRVETATLSELYHLMNKVRRRVELGTEINSVVSRWLFGDANGEGWAFKDRASAVKFMREAYDKNIGPRGRDSQKALDWKAAIDSYEKDGKVDPRVQDAFDEFLEEIGEAIFIGWESGKPFDYVFRGGDIGMVRNVVEALKDRMTNLFERNATNLGADINTKEAFFDWFKKNKTKWRADAHMESAFNDLIRIYQDKGMKNNGRTYRNLYTMSPAAVKEQAEYYGIEERVYQDAEGNWNWKTPERYKKDTHENALLMVNELLDLANSDPEALNGLDFYIFNAKGMNTAVIESQIAKGFSALDKRSRSDFDPITQRTLDTQGVHAKGFLFSSADFRDIGPNFDDIQKAQISQTRNSGIYKQRPSIQEYGNRGRPRTSLSGAMLADALKAIAKGKAGEHLVVFRGIPTEKAFRIINKYVPKQVSKNVRLLAPIIADGGVSSSNVINGEYLGFEQDQGNGIILDRSKGDIFGVREMNFIPYEMEFRVTLRDPRNPTVEYTNPHFAFIARSYDMDALNRRVHIIWNENLEVRQAYNNINDYIKDVHSTISEYSGTGMIPAVKFFGADEYARERRKYVVAAFGAAPTKDVREFYFGDVLAAGEADFHETHYRNALGTVNNPWMSVRLDNLSGASVVEGEGIPNIRVNEKAYRRGMIPTPTYDDSPMMEGMYSAGDTRPDSVPKSAFAKAIEDRIDKIKQEIETEEKWISKRMKESPVMSLDPNTKNGKYMLRSKERLRSLQSELEKENAILNKEIADNASLKKGQFFSAGDGPIPLIVESIPDFHRSTEDGPFDYIKTLKNLNKPSRLIKTLNSHPMFNVKDKTFDFQSAHSFNARSLAEFDFLTSNYKWAEQKGDIFKSESVGRFVRSVGKDATVVRHTLDEHLEVKGDIEAYNRNFSTGKPVVFPVNYAEFKPEFFGPAYKGSNASTINAHVFSARQLTALKNMGSKDSSLRTLVAFSNPLVYDYKSEGKGSMPMERLHKMAMKNGHDGVIMQNVYEGGIIDTLVTVPKGRESGVLVLDKHLAETPVPRNSGHPEGAMVMFSSGDIPKLPEGAFGPNNPETVEISRGLKALKGMKTGDGKFIIKLNQDKSRKVGMEYETMKHDPYNPKVKAAYEALAKETEEQYESILAAGYMPEMHMAPNEPYPNSRATIADIRDRKRLKVFSTDYGYGETPITEKDIKENPMLRMSKYKDANGVPMRVNDLFRFVHDFFGHSERGNSFGPLGEENAWDVHARMFSPLARRAMTSETRGQNSWVNFIHEPNIEINRMRDAARRLEREGKYQEAMELRATIGSTRFADQKIGLMPEWTSKLDEELTPIEAELYGKHVTSDANYGIYHSAGDYAERIWSPSAEEFVNMSAKARSSHKFGTSVDVKNPADLAGYQLLVAGDGKAFAHVSPDGELGGVIRGLNGKSEDVVAVVEAALATKKVKWLSAFDTVLPDMYNAFGFEAAARIKFVDEYRPEGWDYSLYGNFNAGRPDVVFMSYVGGRAVPYRSKRGIMVGSYDDGVAIARGISEAKYSAGDVVPDDGIPDPLNFDRSKLTPISRDNLKVLDLLAQYRNVAKDLRVKIDAGQITDAQANMALNKWHKDNQTGQTALSWSVHRTIDGEKKVYELTDSDIDTMKIDVIASDPRFKKEHLAAKKAEVTRRIETESPPEGLSNKERIKWIAKRRFESKTIAYLGTLDAEQKEAIYRKHIPDYDAKQEKAGVEGLYQKKVNRLANRLFDKELFKLLKQRDEAEANGEPDPFNGIGSKELEEVARQNSIVEAISQIEKIEQLDADDPLMQGDGDIGRYEKALLESGLSKEEAKALVARRRMDVLEVTEEEVSGNKEAERLLEEATGGIEIPREGILRPLTLEEAIAEVKEENKKYFDESQENLWEPEEVEAEAQRRVRVREEILSTFSEEVDPSTGRKAMNPNSLEYMSKVEFANTKWFDKDGNSILWKGEKSGKEYQGIKGKDENGNQTVGGQRVDEDLIALYPDKMENAISSMQKRLKEHLSGENTLNYHDSSMTLLLDLYRLWGYEPNALLKEVDFKPRSESEAVRIATEEGLVGREFTRTVLGLQGKLFTSVEGNSILTERLESLPGFYELTRDVLTDIASGAEFKEGKLENAIEINKAQVEEMLKEFARTNPKYAKYIIIEGGTDVDAYIKRKWEASGKGKVEKNKWKKANNWPSGKDIPPEVSAQIKTDLFAKWKTEAIGSIGVRKGFLGEDSVKSEVYKVLMEENMRKKKLLEARPRNPETGLLLKEQRMLRDPETGEVMQFHTPERIESDAKSITRDLKFRFIEFLNDKAQEIYIAEAERFEQEAGLKTLTPEQRQAKRRAERKAAVEEQQRALAEPQTVEPETPVVEPTVETPKPIEPPKRTVVTETTGQTTEKQRNAENLRRAIAAAEASGNVKDVKKTQASGGKPRMPTDYGYKRGNKEGLWVHPNPRFTIQKIEGKLYTVKESQNVNGNIIEKVHGTFGSFDAAHSIVERNVSAQTPPPVPTVATTAAPVAPKPTVTAPVPPKPATTPTTAMPTAQAAPVVPPKATPQAPKPVGRPPKPVKPQDTPKPVKTAIQNEAEKKVAQNTVKTPEQVGQAQAVVLQAGVIGASSPTVASAAQTVVAVKDDLTLSPVEGAKGIFKTGDGRFVVTKSKNGFKVRMNDHINPVIRADVQGRDIAFVNTTFEAQLAIREYDYYMRRSLESQGVNVGQILQALHPVKTPEQISKEAAEVARILGQQLAQMPNQSKPAIDTASMDLARQALAKLGMVKKDIDVYLPSAISAGVDPSDIQALMRFVLTKGQVRAVYTSNSNIAHVATVNATGGAQAPATPTVTIVPTPTAVQNATGATLPSDRPKYAPISNTLKPVLNDQQLQTIRGLATFTPHSSKIALPNGMTAKGVTYKNGAGYMIVQSGISKWRVYNPASSLISVVDDEQDACNAILKDFYKR